MSADKKYKDFRNFMVNELGITRQDIEAWTKQSVANETQKLIGQINIDGMVRESIRSTVANTVGQSVRSGYSTPSELQKAVAKEIAASLCVEITKK